MQLIDGFAVPARDYVLPLLKVAAMDIFSEYLNAITAAQRGIIFMIGWSAKLIEPMPTKSTRSLNARKYMLSLVLFR